MIYSANSWSWKIYICRQLKLNLKKKNYIFKNYLTEHGHAHHCRRIGVFYYHDMIKWKKQIEVIMWYRLLNLHVTTLHVGWPQCVNDFHWLFRVHLFFIPVVFIQFVRVSTVLRSFCHPCTYNLLILAVHG